MNILKSGYNRKDFLDLVNTIFKRGDISRKIPEVQEVFEEKIKNGYLLGELKLDGKSFAIFEYQVDDELDLEKNKVGLVKKLIKDGKEYFYDALLAAYYNKKTNVWRLSLVNIEYIEGGDKTSSPKRYTYLLGKNIPVNTAIKQITNELIDKDIINVEDFLKAFSVEPVTKEFFKRYKEIFDKFNEYSYQKHINNILFKDGDIENTKKKIRDFNKKLLGRLVFLMFLQKKGWLDASDEQYKDGNKKFLSDLYKKSIEDKDEHFYNYYLESLFYDTLNKKRKDDISTITEGIIPFLNGGLFEKEVNENMLFYPDKLFALLFNESDGLFNQYNFTIIENDNIDQEVAVDPEMLGHIFENLLEDNKDKGAFYTPKEIVDYMSKYSLLEYLKNSFKEKKGKLEEKEEKDLRDIVFFPEIAELTAFMFIKKYKKVINNLLDKVKILDPAIGSGAFPMGMLQAIIKVKEVINDVLDRGKEKRNIIENSIYGVDIESGAVDIARLRFWLSLIVDEEKPSPLPNLDFKIVVGNSLVSILKIGDLKEIIDLSPLKENRVKFENFELLKTAKDDFYKGNGDKRELKKEIRKYETDILTNILEYKMMALESSSNRKYCQKDFSGKPKNHEKCEEYKRKKAALEKTLEDIKTKDYSIFDYYLNFNEVFQENGGFNIVIGNPPYVGEKGNKEVFRPLKSIFKEKYEKNSDLFYFFFMVGIDLLKEKGSLGFITTNYFLTSDSAQVLRQEFKDKTAIINFINFNDMKLFKSALGQHNIITILQKTNKIRKTNLINILKAKENFRDIFIDKANIEFFTKNSNQLYEGDNNYIRISKEGDKLEDIFSKITKYSSFINEICFINTGFNTGADKVTKSNLEKSYNEMPQNIKIKDGIFILTKKECEDIKPEKELIYKCYKNSDIEPYVSNKWQNLYVIWTNKNTNIEKYPNIKNHLNKYIEFLKLKREYETGQLPWYSQHWSREYDVFGNTNKIILPYRSKSNIFSYSDGEYFGSKDILYLRQRDKKFNMKYLLALLNSKLYYTWLYYKGKRKGETLELYVTPVGEIPIKKISKENQNPFEYMVNQIIEEKRKSKDIRLLENKVDLMVYKLYELDYDEIKIIDSDFDVVLGKFKIDKVKYEKMSIEEITKI